MTTPCEVARRKNRRSKLYGMCGPGGLTKLKGGPILPTPGLILEHNRVNIDSYFNTGIRKPKSGCYKKSSRENFWGKNRV